VRVRTAGRGRQEVTAGRVRGKLRLPARVQGGGQAGANRVQGEPEGDQHDEHAGRNRRND